MSSGIHFSQETLEPVAPKPRSWISDPSLIERGNFSDPERDQEGRPELFTEDCISFETPTDWKQRFEDVAAWSSSDREANGISELPLLRGGQ